MSTIAVRSSQMTRDLSGLLNSDRSTRTGVPSSPSASGPSGTSTFGSATVLDLSDHAKSVIAKAKSDQAVAARVAAFAAAARAGTGGASGSNNFRPITTLAIDLPPDDLTGLSPQGNFSSRDGTIWATNTVSTEPGAAHVAFVPTVEPMIDFSSRLQAGGFSITAKGNVNDGTYAVDIEGPDGFAWSDVRSTPGAGLDNRVAGSVPPGSGYIESAPGPGNTQTIHFYENSTSGASVTASSDAGTLSVAEASTRTLMATVSINFSTGMIQMQSSSASATSLSTRLALSV